MSGSTVKASWPLTRAAQAAVAAAALADVHQVVTLRGHHLHPLDTSLSASGRVSAIPGDLLFVAAVLFLVWFSRCRRNAELLSPGTTSGSAAWAVIAWLIPVVNLWVPRGLVLGVHRAGAPGEPEGGDRVLVNVWWAAWAGHSVVETMRTLLGQGTSLVFLLVSEALELSAGALAIVVIQRVTARQATAPDLRLPATVQ